VTFLPWRLATEAALYGPGGFYRRSDPAAHFRTSVHASPLFAGAVLALLDRVDAALGRPDRLDLVDVGAGRGELLTGVAAGAPTALRRRLRLTAVERSARPARLPAPVEWSAGIPPLTGLLIANEWLDNMPVDVAERDAGTDRLVLVDPVTGEEAPGPPVSGADAAWLTRWWPLTVAGSRAEIGAPRDVVWAEAVGQVRRGLAVAVDYGHRTTDRPSLGTLTGFAAGRQVRPVPDGSTDITAHVAVDAVAAAGAQAAGQPARLLRQRAALTALGVTAARPDRALATTDPTAYLRALATAGQAGELLDPTGLGAFWWLLQPVGISLPLPADYSHG